MFNDRWLATIDLVFTSFFWGVGYFFGFNLILVLSVGMVSPEEFSFILKGRITPRRFWLFLRDGSIYLKAEVVSLVGWLFLLAIVWAVAFALGC